MTNDRRETDRRSTATDDGDDRTAESDRESAAIDGDGPSFADIFERAPADVSADAVASAVQTIRTGDRE